MDKGRKILYTKTITEQILHHKNTSKMKKHILNKLLTSVAVLFVFTIGEQTQTQFRYFKESNEFFENPTAISFTKELFGKDTNTARIFRVSYLNDKIALVDNKSYDNYDAVKYYKYQYIFDNKNQYEKLVKYIGNKSDGVTNTYECDEFGKILKNTNGFYGTVIYRYKYDNQGRQIEEATYDIEDKLIGGYDGVAIYRKKFDNEGREIEKAYYDKENKLIDGIAIKRTKYINAFDYQEVYFNKKNKRINSAEGYNKIIYTEYTPRYYNKKDKEVFLNTETNKYE